MFLSSIIATFATLCGRAPWMGAAQPSFEGLLDDLFATCPLEGEEAQEGWPLAA